MTHEHRNRQPLAACHSCGFVLGLGKLRDVGAGGLESDKLSATRQRYRGRTESCYNRPMETLDADEPMDADSYLRGTAYHEAGHAVAAFALRLCVFSIILRERGAGNSETKTDPADLLPLTDHLAVLAAGKVAERAFKSPLPDHAGDRDSEKALNLILKHHEGASSDDIELHMTAGHVCARALLAEHQDRVIRVAEHLREARRVNAAMFLHLMGV
jgi:hypothetical protein